MDLRICHLYPDLLNLYGDRGNLTVLVTRARWRGIVVAVDAVGIGDPLPVGRHDLYLIGGGEDRQQRLAAADLTTRKADALREAAGRGAVVLAICGGYQLLGHSYRPAAGEELVGVGLLDVVTVHPGPQARRLIGNVVVRCPLLGGAALVGFENHGGRTYLGPGAAPLGRVVVGSGNNGEDGTEGAVSGHVYGTYLHGPLLPRNPAFADHLLAAALRVRHGDVSLAPLTDDLEAAAHAAGVARATGTRP
ncbi:MAG: glutamine amidotransferase [Armatimonadota bacterium]|nr:glutamine amidotransferase [Armatimonadota bacterium]MDR7436317.1 glutamine amidotransferase [Armatimonadota bacterium]MDR7471303.1 glutamine amidotransferase [Armatimonadota bacterium]MDR7506890.1 glutamine amidotransferase [Armatimonadota bacterium]MDR7509317.1 glutamine amidotransferase [Armatimonadota bacterium]